MRGVLNTEFTVHVHCTAVGHVQTLDSAIHWINHYPVDKYLGNQLCYSLDRDLSIGLHS